MTRQIELRDAGGEEDANPRREKAALRLAQEIVHAMYENGMLPGDKYFSEGEAMRRHGASRATLREALRFLEMQGVITMHAGPGGGARVGRPDWPNLASTMALLLQFDQAPFKSVLEAKRALDPGMAELAALNSTDEELDAMAKDLDALEISIGRFRDWSVIYSRFWSRLARSTHNSVISFLSPALRALVDSGGFVPNELYRGEVLKRLRSLHATLAAHDAAAARAAMAELEDEFYRRIAEGYPRQMERLISWGDLDT